jgi:phosphatidylglycerophosphate synthase
MPDTYSPNDRRPIASRDTRLAQAISHRLATWRVSPNQISVLGLLFSVGAAACFWGTASETGPMVRVLWFAGALGIQLRLLCNLFDGMVALERGIASPVGELYNEVPDRVSDALTLVGLGAALGGSLGWGWAAALVAVFVAYTRSVVAQAGAPVDFRGPLAKAQRMALVTVAAVYLALRPSAWAWDFGEARAVLIVITILGLVTAAGRLMRGAHALRVQSAKDADS